jgi:hypothetical protein
MSAKSGTTFGFGATPSAVLDWNHPVIAGDYGRLMNIELTKFCT